MDEKEITIKLTEREASSLQGVLMFAILEQDELYSKYIGKGYFGIAWSHKAEAYYLMGLRTKIRKQIPYWVDFDRRHEKELKTQQGQDSECRMNNDESDGESCPQPLLKKQGDEDGDKNK